MIWAVEAWRGAAALLVVWAHWAAPLGFVPHYSAYAFVGVDVFFVLSGFVFGPALFGGVGPLVGYARRRLLRIYPAYLVALAVYVALAAAQGRALRHLGEHVLMAHLQSREMAFYYNPAFWSLPAEVSFYVALPLLALAVRRGGRVAFAVLLALALAARLALLQAADGAAQNGAYLALHHLPGLAVEFLLGAAAWRLRDAATVKTSGGAAAHGPDVAAGQWAHRRRLWAALGALTVALTVALYPRLEAWVGGHDWKNGQLGAVTAAGFALWLAATGGWQPQAHWARALGVWAGRLSYAVYLLHMAWLPVAVAIAGRFGRWPALIAALMLLFLTSLALHRWVEEPARRYGRRQNTSVSPG